MARIDFFAWEFNSWLLGTRAFLDALSHAVSEAAAADAADALKRRAEAEGWDADDYFNEEDILQENFEHWLPRLSTYAVVILLHSLVETQLHACARRLRRDRALELDVRDLHGSGVAPARTYLIKIAHLDIANDLGWHELSNLQSIRNVIIHRRGRIGDSPDHRAEVDRLLKEYPQDLTLTPSRSRAVTNTAEQELTISFRLCSHFVQEIDAFFHRLFKAAGFPEIPIQL